MNTNDLSKLGYREIDIAADLLKAYATGGRMASNNVELGDGFKIEFNPNSGNVFLVDDDYNVVMLNDSGKLENWLNCPQCGEEGFISEYGNGNQFDGYCSKKCKDETN